MLILYRCDIHLLKILLEEILESFTFECIRIPRRLSSFHLYFIIVLEFFYVVIYVIYICTCLCMKKIIENFMYIKF